MLNRTRIIISLLFTVMLGMQTASIWHGSEHFHADFRAQHECSLCAVVQIIPTINAGLVLAAVMVLVLWQPKTSVSLVQLISPVFKFRCRDPPVKSL